MFDGLNMESKDWVMTFAVIAGPILAVQAQKIIESFREQHSRRLQLFKTIMSTRAERLSRDHVQALNMIDIEFYGRKIFGTRFQTPKEKSITNSWKNYNQHLNERNNYESLDSWLKKGDELFTKLLYEISQSLGYDYDEVQLRRDCYRPEAHFNIENTQLEVLTGFADVLKGKRSFPMAVTHFPPQIQQDAEVDLGHNKSTNT
jgi:hypothetical protein